MARTAGCNRSGTNRQAHRDGISRPAATFGFVRDAKQRLASQPGVEGVTFMAGVLPPWFDPDVHIALQGVPSDALSSVQRHAVDADFLGVMDITLLQGRALHATDHGDAPRVALVSETLARAIAGGNGKSAIGRTLQLVRNAERRDLTAPIEVVGIVADVRYHGPIAARTVDHDLYVPLGQAPGRVLSIAVHTSMDAAQLIPQFQRELGRLAPTSPPALDFDDGSRAEAAVRQRAPACLADRCLWRQCFAPGSPRCVWRPCPHREQAPG